MELIKIQKSEGGKSIVSARELYEALGLAKSAFARWAKMNITESKRAKEKADWVGFNIMLSGNNCDDYALTLQFAKKLAMLADTDKGDRVRDYFIECEKKLAEIATAPPVPVSIVPTTLKDALLLAYQQQCKIEEQDTVIAELAPKAEYANEVLLSESEWTTTTIAKELNMSAIALNLALKARGVQFKSSDDMWVLYAKYLGKGYTKTRTKPYATNDGTKTSIYTVWTEKGRMFIHSLFHTGVENYM